MNTVTINTENLIHIGSVVSEIWPGKFKSWGTFISSALPLAGGAYPVRGDDVGILVVVVVVVVVVRQLLLQIATPPKLLARSFSNFTQ